MSGTDDTEKALRLNPEAMAVLRAKAPMLGLEGLEAEIEHVPVRAPAQKNRLRSKIPFYAGCEAAGLSGVTVLAAVLMLERTMTISIDIQSIYMLAAAAASGFGMTMMMRRSEAGYRSAALGALLVGLIVAASLIVSSWSWWT
jgi:hypothetical protein